LKVSANPPGGSYRVVGSFELSIPVKKEATILRQEMNKCAIKVPLARVDTEVVRVEG
jgi:hypothetical protein